MSGAEQLTITLPEEVAATVHRAVAGGGYASSSDVVREALAEWAAKRAEQAAAFASLKADIAVGLADIEAGRVVDFDIERIIEAGRRRSAGRSASG